MQSYEKGCIWRGKEGEKILIILDGRRTSSKLWRDTEDSIVEGQRPKLKDGAISGTQ